MVMLEAFRTRSGGLARAVVARLMLVGAALLLGIVTPAAAADVPARSPEQGSTTLDELDLANPEAGEALVPPPETPAQRSPFIHDSKFAAQLRTFYFNRDKYDNTRSEAWAIGGSLSYTSGYLANLFRLGAVLYTSQPLYAPDDRDGTLLLAPGQEGYTVLGQLYGEFKLTDQVSAAIGRKEYETPYVNKNDVRMTPNTFEGITVYGRSGGKDGAPEWRFGGGYLSKIKPRNSDEFEWMSVAAGATVERGVYFAGANYKDGGLSIGAINYYSDDIINIFYTEGKYAMPGPGGSKLAFAAQFTDQRSTGDDLLTGSDFSTNQWGVKADASIGPAVLTLAYTDMASGAATINPWSGYPGYTSVQVKDFNRASEKAVLLKAAYDFSSHGAKGLSAYALWVHGFDVASPNYNEDEYDINLQWTPDKAGPLRGLSFRLRYARVDQRGGGDPTINDFRFIVNYDFPRP